MGTFPVFKFGGKGVDVTLRTEYDPPGVFWSHRYNSYVLVADPERGEWSYKGNRVSLVSISGYGEIRWAVRVPIRPGAWSGTDDSEPATKYFGLTPWVQRNGRKNMVNGKGRRMKSRRNSEGGGFAVTTPEGIAAYRMLALKGMLKLETLGMKRRGPSVFSVIKREFGLKGSKQSVLAQFTKMCEEVVAHRAKPPGFNPGKKSGYCGCLFWHATTPEERKKAKAMLDYSRRVGDSLGAMMALKALTGKCLKTRRNPLTRREQGKVLGLAARAGKRLEKYDERNVEDDFYSGSALGKQSAYKHIARRFGPRKSVRRNPNRKLKVTWKLGEAAHVFLSYLDNKHLSIWRNLRPVDIMEDGSDKAAIKESGATVQDRYVKFYSALRNLWPMVPKETRWAPLRVLAGAWGMMEQMRSDF